MVEEAVNISALASDTSIELDVLMSTPTMCTLSTLAIRHQVRPRYASRRGHRLSYVLNLHRGRLSRGEGRIRGSIGPHTSSQQNAKAVLSKCVLLAKMKTVAPV